MKNIDELTLGEIKQLQCLFGGNTPNPCNDKHWHIGSDYLIRTVTMIDTGRLVAVTPQELVLEDAAWIADTGRFSGSLASCDFSEVEPFPKGTQVIIGRGSIIDAVKIPSLPSKQK